MAEVSLLCRLWVSGSCEALLQLGRFAAGEAGRSAPAPEGASVLLKVFLLVRTPGVTAVVDGRVVRKGGVRLRV